MKSKLSTREIRQFKAFHQNHFLQMLTCYDYQTAQMLDQTELHMILVGDSVGNVVLGFETTIEVTLDHMILFGQAVRKGAPHKFLVLDMPFGTYSTVESGLFNATQLFQKTKADALKLEGAFPYQLELITRLTQVGIPVMGHIGLRPQSVHQQGGHYIHGKNDESKQELILEAESLEKAGCFSVVLECVEKNVAAEITQRLKIPTIGIGSGKNVDGQVLVINDLFKFGKERPPLFCVPMTDLYQQRLSIVEKYLSEMRP